MKKKTRVALLHHLPRSGGTVLSRCIGSLESVALLSEINPHSVTRFNPLVQARDWHGLFDADLDTKMQDGDTEGFKFAIAKITSALASTPKQLVVRDWSHVDFMGIPIESDRPGSLRLASTLASDFDVMSVASIRNPVDQYLSMHKLPILQESWDSELVWRAMRKFAEQIQGMPWIRYEQFVVDPEKEIKRLCEHWQIQFDDRFLTRWTEYVHVTGDPVRLTKREIQRTPRSPVPDDFWLSVVENDDFYATLDILGYSLPEQLRRPTKRESIARFSTNTIQEVCDLATTAASSLDFDTSAKLCREILEFRPDHDFATNQLGYCLLELGELQEARELLETYLERVPEATVSLRNLISCYTRLGLRFEALPWKRRLAELDPRDFNNLYVLATDLSGIGAVTEAQTYLRTVVRESNILGAKANHVMFLNYEDQVSPAKLPVSTFDCPSDSTWANAGKR